jgi:DNA polymerase elongation subunit (family B)
MKRIIFDIETAGKDLDTLDAPVQDYLLRNATSQGEQKEVEDSLSFYPLTAEIITIGMFDPDTRNGFIFFQNNSDPTLPFEENGCTFETGTEKEIIQKFWNTIQHYNQFITFNGRSFDCPFILIRSAVHHIRPNRELLPYRYGDIHIDLLDQLSFYGAFRRRFSLDMWCRTFGIKSPKEEGITGYEVKGLYKAGKHLDIARYCAGDLRATADLFLIWEKYIKFSSKSKS